MERAIQQLQIDARKRLVQSEFREPENANKLSWVEARRQSCRQARYPRYTSVHELRRKGQPPLEIAETVGIDEETVARWLNVVVFPKCRKNTH